MYVITRKFKGWPLANTKSSVVYQALPVFSKTPPPARCAVLPWWQRGGCTGGRQGARSNGEFWEQLFWAKKNAEQMLGSSWAILRCVLFFFWIVQMVFFLAKTKMKCGGFLLDPFGNSENLMKSLLKSRLIFEKTFSCSFLGGVHQPIWKICASQIGSFPQPFGVKKIFELPPCSWFPVGEFCAA